MLMKTKSLSSLVASQKMFNRIMMYSKLMHLECSQRSLMSSICRILRNSWGRHSLIRVHMSSALLAFPILIFIRRKAILLKLRRRASMIYRISFIILKMDSYNIKHFFSCMRWKRMIICQASSFYSLWLRRIWILQL